MKDLTPRQTEIAQLVARGMTSRAIADHTGLSVHTVNQHVNEAAARVAIPGSPRNRLVLWVLQHEVQSAEE